MEWHPMGERYTLRLERGEEVIGALTEWVKERGITAASMVGIGALEQVELGYYELPTKTYHRHTFPEDYELLNLTGNVSLLEDGETFVHAHVTIGGRDYSTKGGHLFSARVAVTVELVLTPLPGQIRRAFDEACGLKLWRLSET